MRIKLLIASAFLIGMSVFLSCNNTEESQPECNFDNPNLQVNLNDSTALRFNSVGFVEREDNVAEFLAKELDAFCIQIGSLSIRFERKLGEQDLIISTPGYGIIEVGEIVYFEVDDDLLLGTFELYEGEPNSFVITELEDELIVGNITATLVRRESRQKFITLPDTLRFNNTQFRAIRFDPSN